MPMRSFRAARYCEASMTSAELQGATRRPSRNSAAVGSRLQLERKLRRHRRELDADPRSAGSASRADGAWFGCRPSDRTRDHRRRRNHNGTIIAACDVSPVLAATPHGHLSRTISGALDSRQDGLAWPDGFLGRLRRGCRPRDRPRPRGPLRGLLLQLVADRPADDSPWVQNLALQGLERMAGRSRANDPCRE